MKLGLAAILCLLSIGITGEFVEKEWKKEPASQLTSKDLQRLNWSNEEYEVSILSGKLVYSKPSKRADNVKALPNGKLVASNQGEFGGGLYQHFEKGKGSRKIIAGNFHSFFDCRGRTYVLDGLAHLTLNSGRVWNIYEMNGVWHLGKSIEVGGSPYTFCFKNDTSIYLVTPTTLLDVNLETSQVKIIVRNAFWDGQYPNSIVKISDSTLWLGMRGGILKIEGTDNPNLIWFSKK